MKCFSANFYGFLKLCLLTYCKKTFLKARTEMGKRSHAAISGNFNQDLIENKENIRKIAMLKDKKKSYLGKHSKKCLNDKICSGIMKKSKKLEGIEIEKEKVKSLKSKAVESVVEKKLAKSSNKALEKQIMLSNHDDSVNVSKALKKPEDTTKSLITTDSIEDESPHVSDIRNNQCCNHKCHDIHFAKHAVVVLRRLRIPLEMMSNTSSDSSEDMQLGTMSNKSSDSSEDMQMETMSITSNDNSENIQVETMSSKSSDSSNDSLEDIKKADNILNKSKNNLFGSECHSSLLLKEAIVSLKRLDQSQIMNSNTMLEKDEKVRKIPNKSGKGTKRKREEKSTKKDKDSSKSTKSKKQKDSNDSKKSKKEKIPDVSAIDFNNDSKSPSGNDWNFKISSWNINGIRAWLEKDGLSYLHHEQPDILCVQETKCSDDKLPSEMKTIDGYHTYWLSGDKDGYSGVGLLTKVKPIKVDYGIGIADHDNEGRVITAEYDKFYLVSTYVPNAGRGLVRLDYRMKWDKDFREYLKKLDAEKPVILTGDLNVAHEEIDLANPKNNKRNAGFTKEEREGFSALLKEGFVDTFRQLYPDVKGAYTFWTYMMNARAKNVGWRLDYFVLSERFTENLCDNVIRKDVFGSDHCPITLFLAL